MVQLLGVVLGLLTFAGGLSKGPGVEEAQAQSLSDVVFALVNVIDSCELQCLTATNKCMACS